MLLTENTNLRTLSIGGKDVQHEKFAGLTEVYHTEQEVESACLVAGHGEAGLFILYDRPLLITPVPFCTAEKIFLFLSLTLLHGVRPLQASKHFTLLSTL